MNSIFEIFKTVSPNHVGLFAKMFCALLAIQTLISFGRQLRYFKTEPRRIYGEPLRLLGKFQLPNPSVRQFTVLGSIFISSLIFAAAGFAPRFFIFLALCCYFPYFNAIISLADVQRKTNLLPLILLIFFVSPALALPLDAKAATWEIVLIKIAIAQIYLSAGIQKIKIGGWSWFGGGSLQAHLIEHFLWNDRESAFLLAQNKTLCSVPSILTLFFELTFWIIIFVPQLTVFYVGAAVLFHLGTLITMRINYFKYLSPAYMVFFTDIGFRIKEWLTI